MLHCSTSEDLILSSLIKFYKIEKFCIGRTLNVTRPGEVMTSWSSTESIHEVKALSFNTQIVKFIPKFDVLLARRLEGLQIQHSQLKSIEKADLQQFPSLRLLWLRQNDLEHLSSDLFKFNKNLESIDFAFNKLRFVGANLLQPLQHLRDASFVEAGCIDLFAFRPVGLATLESKLIAKCSARHY